MSYFILCHVHFVSYFFCLHVHFVSVHFVLSCLCCVSCHPSLISNSLNFSLQSILKRKNSNARLHRTTLKANRKKSNQTAPKATRRKIERPNESEMTKTTFPCPHCSIPLEAREWGDGALMRTEVNTPSGYVLIKHAGIWMSHVLISFDQFWLVLIGSCIRIVLIQLFHHL